MECDHTMRKHYIHRTCRYYDHNTCMQYAPITCNYYANSACNYCNRNTCMYWTPHQPWDPDTVSALKPPNTVTPATLLLLAKA